MSINERKHLNIFLINNKNFKIIKIIEFNLYYYNFIFINKIRIF